MAIPPPALASSPIPEDTFSYLCALLRDIRAEAQNLQASLAKITSKADLADKAQRESEIKAALGKASAVLDRNRAQIQARLDETRVVFQHDPKQYAWCGDEVTKVENFWDRATAAWPEDSQAADVIVANTQEASEYLDKIILSCGWLTIPSRLDQLLANLRIGQPLDFQWAFQDELPKAEHRLKILENLARQPGIVEGVVDAPNGLIYRSSPSAGRRRLSIFLILGTALAGAMVVYLITRQWADNWPFQPSQFGGMMQGYVFSVLGAMFHLLVNALKQYRSGSERSFMAIQDWMLWLHVRETSSIWSIVYLWVGYFGLTWIQGVMTWQTAFFVGYSIDSVVDLFLSRFEKAAESRIEGVKQQIGHQKVAAAVS